jgi:hypothetical protein
VRRAWKSVVLDDITTTRGQLSRPVPDSCSPCMKPYDNAFARATSHRTGEPKQAGEGGGNEDERGRARRDSSRSVTLRVGFRSVCAPCTVLPRVAYVLRHCSQLIIVVELVVDGGLALAPPPVYDIEIGMRAEPWKPDLGASEAGRENKRLAVNFALPGSTTSLCAFMADL